MMIDKMSMIRKSLIVLFVILTAWSCRDSYGYGVVLWSANEIELTSGSIVRIVGESPRREIFRVQHPDTKAIIEVDKWRLEQFPKRQQAQAYLEEYIPFLRTYTEVRKSALPMREDALVSSKSVYSLRDGQVMKVLGRAKEREQIGGYKAYWYHLLSSDGVQGWTYGRFLREYTLSESGQAIYDEKDYTGDAILENFFDPINVWHPAYMYDMVKDKAVHLSLMREEYGLFINPESKVISIRLPDQNVDFTYTRITPVGGDAYMFVDSPFSFTLKPNLVQARYTLRGQKYTPEFRTLEKGIKDIIAEEETRRGQKYRNFMEAGPILHSEMATINFSGNGRFIMSNMTGLLQLQTLLESDGYEGVVLFDVMLEESLLKKYDGAISFVFDASGKRLTFVYHMGVGGFEATLVAYVPDNKIILPQHIGAINTIFAR